MSSLISDLDLLIRSQGHIFENITGMARESPKLVPGMSSLMCDLDLVLRSQGHIFENISQTLLVCTKPFACIVTKLANLMEEEVGNPSAQTW